MSDLLVFDLDGTLLSANSTISDYTARVLRGLTDVGVAYTVATGRSLHGAQSVLKDHGFTQPHIVKNGVLIWDPESDAYSRQCLLTQDEIAHILLAFTSADVSPFVHTFENGSYHGVYHSARLKDYEQKLAAYIERERGEAVRPLNEMSPHAPIANFSGLGSQHAIETIVEQIALEPHLLAYGGPAFEGRDLYWLDVHHCEGNKGAAVKELKQQLGADRVICFGDSDNDVTMFECADESYAPDNAKPQLLELATGIIGHHDNDGIAHYLSQRYGLRL